MASMAATLVLCAGPTRLTAPDGAGPQDNGVVAKGISSLRSGEPKGTAARRPDQDLAPAFPYAGPSPGQDDDFGVWLGRAGMPASA
jgi:hypothetical protein